MGELKTKRSRASVSKFLSSIEHPRRREDALALLALFKETTGLSPAMWGDSIVGFGQYHYKSERSTQEGDWPLTGFSPRKRNMSVYIMPGFNDYQPLLDKLGKHTTSVSCLYFTQLEHLDQRVLKQIIRKSVAQMKKRYEWST